MLRMQHILVATDFSDASTSAVEAARSLAERYGAKVSIFHAFDAEALVPPGAIPHPRDYRESIEHEMRDAVERKLAEIRDGALAGLPNVEVRTGVGPHPASTIVDTAKATEADLIVVATHGRTGLGRLLIGSVAERVIRHAHCPVLAVRPST